MACVLLVASDRIIGAPIADAIEDAGHELMWCPGPRRPTFACAASKGRCPLAAEADVAVVDGRLRTDEEERGLASWFLLRYYRGQGIPVVFLAPPEGAERSARDARVVPLDRHTDPSRVVAALSSLLVTDERRVSDVPAGFERRTG